MSKRISSSLRSRRTGSYKVVRNARPKRRIRQNNAYEIEVARLVNVERAARGIAPVTLSPTLSDVARVKSIDMRDNNYFSHTSPTYGGPEQLLNRFGISRRSWGENISAGYNTPASVMANWMNSPGHRANILNPNFNVLGVGYVPGTPTSTYSSYWTQLFIQT